MPGLADTVVISPSIDATIIGPVGSVDIDSLDLGHSSIGTTNLQLTATGAIQVAQDVIIQEGGQLDAGTGTTFSFGGNIQVNGGDIAYTTETNTTWSPSSTVQITNGGTFSIEHTGAAGARVPPVGTILVKDAGSIFELTSTGATAELNIPDDTLLQASMGARVQSAGLLTLSGGTLQVQGPDTSLAATTLHINPSTSDELSELTFSDDSTTELTGALNLGVTTPPGALYRATMTIHSGASVSMDGNINLGTASQPGQAGTVASMNVGGVGTNAMVHQTGSGTITIGATSDGDSQLSVMDGGMVMTGSGDTTVNPTGTLSVTGGMFKANGPIRLDGGNLNVSGGSVTTPTLDLNPPTGAPMPSFTHTGGTVTIEGGDFDRGSSAPYSINGPADPHLILRGIAMSVGVGNRLDVGETEQGSLTVSDGGLVFGGITSIGRRAGSVGTINIDGLSAGGGLGVAGTTSKLITTTMFVGSQGNGTLHIINGGKSIGDSVLGTNVLLGSSSGSVGTANVVGTDGTPGPGTERSTWDIDIGMTVGSRGTAVLNIRDGALVRVDGTAAIASNTGPAGTGHGTVTVSGSDGHGTDAEWSIGADLFVGGKQSGPGGTGIVHIETGGAVDVTGQLLIWPDGIVNLSGGTLIADALDISAGTFSFTSGTLTVDDMTGSLVQDGGVLSPGGSAGITNIDGNYNINGGLMRIEVFPTSPGPDTNPGVDHDQVNITSTVNLGGIVEVVPRPGVDLVDDAPLGTEYHVLTYGTRAGGSMFSSVTGTVLHTGFALAPLFMDTDEVPDGDDDALILRATVPGDLNFDNKVSVADLSEFALNFNTNPGLYSEPTNKNSWELGDFNSDGAVTVADLSLLALNFGFDLDADTTPVGLSLKNTARMMGIRLDEIPEPSMALISCLTLGTGLCNRSRPFRHSQG